MEYWIYYGMLAALVGLIIGYFGLRPEKWKPPEGAILFYIREEENGFLSNFWRSEQVVGAITYPTNEHYYQSRKAIGPGVAEWIRQAPTAWLAMVAGRGLREKETRAIWYGDADCLEVEPLRIAIMRHGLRAKFSDPGLRQQLLDTGDVILGENSPTDMYWGIRGQNHLGKLIMEVRDEIRAGIES